MPPPSPAYGFLGAGEITAAIVAGTHRTATEAPAVFLSPRGRSVGRDLAGRFPNVHVCESNQEVLEYATSIVLAVRPENAQPVVTELAFHPQHTLMSAVAGVRLEQLRDWAAPADQIVRAIPLPQAAQAQSLTAMYPENAIARELFSRVGDVLVPEDEAGLATFSAATATFATHLDYLATIVGWMTDNGVDRDTATTYITRIFGQMGQSLLQRTDCLAVLTEQHSTPGGINEQVRTDLRSEGMPDMVRHALDRILARLRE